MGTRLIQLVCDDPGLSLAAALVRADHPRAGQDAAAAAGRDARGIFFSPSLSDAAHVDVMIDFSLPPAVPGIVQLCRSKHIPLVVGTTGLDTAQRDSADAAAVEIPILIAPNMSRAVNLLMRLVASAAQTLGPAADVAIIERHHKTKKDAPSGTALRLAEMVGRSPGGPPRPSSAPGPAPREIAIHALRMADCPGEHTVIFSVPGETLELSHRAINRDGFARGALDASRFLAGKPPGLYTMEHVLGC